MGSEWISVDERLPEHPILCLGRVPDQHFRFCVLWLGGGDIEADEKIYGKITHWMPIPEIPKETEKQNAAI
jgi:hypothetical protein